jgi:hypothetical protein
VSFHTRLDFSSFLADLLVNSLIRIYPSDYPEIRDEIFAVLENKIIGLDQKRDFL